MYEPLTPAPPLTPPQAPVAGPAGTFTTPETATPTRRRNAGLGLVVGAVLASSLLASGGTYLAVSAAQRPATSAPAGAKTEVAVAAGQTPVVDIVKAVSPAVVTIVADGITSTDPTTGQTGTGTATGSGVIFDASGLILTNHHVVEGNPSSLTVNLKDGRSLDATVYGIDTLTDLAIVKVDATGLPTATIGDSSTIQVGQEAIAIGSPLGTFTDSVTSGIISAVGRTHPGRGRQCPDQPHPDRHRDQPRQQRRPAARPDREGHRHQHGRLTRRPGHRLRHPDRHRAAAAGPGLGRPAARPPVPRHPVRDDRPDGPEGQQPAGRRGRLDPVRGRRRRRRELGRRRWPGRPGWPPAR